MNKYLIRILTVVVVSIMVLFTLSNLTTATSAPQVGQSGSPSVVSYQGQVMVDGSLFDGTGFFKFAIVDEIGGTSYWSNDGSSAEGGEPETFVALSVISGLFNVLLGDTNLEGMTQALTSDVFSETDRWLRVWFSADEASYQLLEPDQRIAAVPYAMQAEYALQAEYSQQAGSATNANTLDGLDGSAYQLQVSGTCNVGSTIRTVKPDGTVECEIDAPFRRSAVPEPNTLIEMDRSHLMGFPTSATIGIDGLPVISYFDSTDSELKVAHCGYVDCSTGNTFTVVDSIAEIVQGNFTSIIIGADGLPVISYFDDETHNLKIAHCGNVTCSTGNTITMLDSTSGLYSSIAIGTDGLPIISYFDIGADNIKVVHCGDFACAIGNTFTDYDPEFYYTNNYYTSMAIGADGFPVISYYDDRLNLRIIHCGDITCSTGNIDNVVDTTEYVGIFSSIAIGADGLPVISYYDSINGVIKVAHCENAVCSTSSKSVIGSSDDIGSMYSSITIGADGLPVITCIDSTNSSLNVIHCSDVICSSGHIINKVDTGGNFGIYSDITIGVDGLPVISYIDFTSNNLMVAHCANAYCIPYWRRP